MGKSTGGSYLPGADYTRTGATDTGGTYASATLTSPTLSSPTLTSPTITSPTITGTTTIGAGATLTSPTLISPTTTGSKPAVISGSGATVTLTAAQSGATFLFDRAAGIVVTLPTPAAGISFDFIVATSITSNAAAIAMSAGSIFIVGSVLVQKASDGTNLSCFADGTSIVTISMNGTTTGGLKGTWMRLRAISTTVWAIEGFVNGSGTIATPFA